MILAITNPKVRMNDYNFWADFLDTFQSSPDWIKALWLLVPPGFLLGCMALVMRFLIEGKGRGRDQHGELVYSVHRDRNNLLHVVSHVPLYEERPALLLPVSAGGDEAGSQGQSRLSPPA